MKKIIMILVFVMLTANVNALIETVTDTATVSLRIINQPPRLIALTFSPKVAYQDSILQCNPEVKDEVPDKIELQYKWYINGNKIANTPTLDGFEEDDQITCEALALDHNGLKSNTLTRTIQIQKTPTTTKAAMFVMNALGVQTTTQKTLELQSQGMASITGFVVGEMNIGGTMLPIILFLLILVVLININLTMRYLIKKRSQSN